MTIANTNKPPLSAGEIDVIKLREQADQQAEDYLCSKGEFHPDYHEVSDRFFANAVLDAAAEQADTFPHDPHSHCAAAIREMKK